ncbi:MAG: hypothetical protein FIA96_06440 [Betaproteobacteria bacterium]|nr:hypothetical protein [Betaproteobacteria bacterium]
MIGGDYQGKNPEIQNASITWFGPDATLKADAGKVGDGGTVIVWADDTTRAYGSIFARGGALGGNGGFVETAGHKLIIGETARVATTAPHGKAGQWLLDPYDFTIASTGGDITGATLSSALDSNSVVIQTTATSASCSGAICGSGNSSGSGDIFVNDNVVWSSDFGLTLSAYRNINVNSVIAASGNSASLTLTPNTGALGGSYILGIGGRIDLTGSNPGLTLAGQSYTVINSLGVFNDASTTTLQGMKNNLAGRYALGSNIDASATSGWDGGQGFVAIGNYTSNFNGMFDGLGHVITGLSINRPSEPGMGLFGYVGTGAIDNVGLVGGTVTGDGYVGGLVGANNFGAIRNSYAIGSVAGNSYVGGLAGINYSGTVSKSYAGGSVHALNNSVGGLLGSNDYGNVSNSYATSSVAGNAYIGGLVGYNYSGSVSSSYSTGIVTGGSFVGGLVGINTGTVSNSFWDIQASGQSASAGGTGLTTAEAMQSANYPSWDFTNTWYQMDGNTRPFLRMEYSTSITNAHQLQLMALNQNASYSLANDINLAELSQASGLWNTTTGFVPVNLAGKFDGNGYTITGLTINRPAADFVGLFGQVGADAGDAGIIRNVGLVNVTVNGLNYVGGLVGELYGTGSVTNCYSMGTVSGSGQFIGGLAGLNFRGSISNSYTSGTVTGTGINAPAPYGSPIVYVGGLVGETYGEGIDGVISNSHSSAVVQGYGDGVGGLVGYIFGGIIQSSYSTGAVTGTFNAVGGLAGQSDGVSVGGTIDVSYSSGAVSGLDYVGGLVGMNRHGTISNSYSVGQASGNNNVGGLVGQNRTLGTDVGGTITNSYSTGNAVGNNYVGGLAGFNGGSIGATYATGAVSGNSYVGGLAGAHSPGTISDSYAIGAVSASSTYAGGLVGFAAGGTISNSYSTGSVSGGSNYGGLVGYDGGTSITNSFWDTQTSGQSTSAGGTGLTTAQMQTAATFTGAGWSVDVWNLADGAYPTLKNMPAPPVPVCAGYDNCWTGAVDSLWATAGNWSAGHVPTGAETVKMDVTGTPTITLSGVNPSFGSLWLAENLDVDAGVTFALNNLFTLTSGTATFNGTASVHTYSQTGGILAGNGAFTVTNSFTKTGGTINRAGDMTITQASGVLDFAATQVGGLILDASTINLGPVASIGWISLYADNLHISGAASSAGMYIQPKDYYMPITLGTNTEIGLSLAQSDLDNISTGPMQVFANNVSVDSSSPTTPVTFAHVDRLQLGSHVAVNSPLTLLQADSSLWLNASTIDINAGLTAGTGGVFFGPIGTYTPYLVGVAVKTHPPGTVELTNTELSRIVTTGPVVIGDSMHGYNSDSGSMQVAGPINLTGITSQLRLVASDITQAPGATITVPQLAVDGYGGIVLTEANNVGTFAARSVGDISFTNAAPLTIGMVGITMPLPLTTDGVIAGGTASISAQGPLTLSAAAGQTVTVSGSEVWLTFNGDLDLNAGAGGRAYVEATSPGLTHLDFSNSAGQVKFNGSVATAVTNGVASPASADFIGFWNQGVAAVPGSTLLLSNTSFSFGGAPCAIGFTDCWIGAVDSLWTNGANWQDGTAPASDTDSVKINSGTTHSPYLTTGTVSLSRIFLDGNITTDSGVIFNISDLFTLNAGTITLNGTTSLANYVQTGGTLAGSGSFTVTNSFAQSGGVIDRTGAMNITHNGNLPLGLITTTGALSITATGAIYDSNGSALNLKAGTIGLVSVYGGSAGELAINADVEAGSSITATVDAAAANGGISIRNTGATQPLYVSLSDNAAANSKVSFTHTGSDLTLGDGYHYFSTSGGSGGTGSIFVAAPSNSLTYADYGGGLSGHDIILAAGNNLNLNGGLYASGNVGLIAGNMLAINSNVLGYNLALAAPVVNVNGSGFVYAENDVSVLGSTINLASGAWIEGTNVFLGGGTMNLNGQVTAHGQLEFDLDNVNAGYGGSLAAYGPTSNITGIVSRDIVLDEAHFGAGNDVALTFTGPTSTIALSNGGHVLANSPSTIYLDFLARSSGGVLIDGVATTTSVPGGSGFFVVNTATPAIEGAGLNLVYAISNFVAADPCATNPDLCKPPSPNVSPMDFGSTLPVLTQPEAENIAGCDQDSFGCDDEWEDQSRQSSQAIDGMKPGWEVAKSIGQCSF